MLENIGNPLINTMDGGDSGQSWVPSDGSAPTPASSYRGPLSPGYKYGTPPLSTMVYGDSVAADIVAGLPIDVSRLPRQDYVSFPGQVKKPVSDEIVAAIKAGRMDPAMLYSSAARPTAGAGAAGGLLNNKMLLIVGALAIAAVFAGGMFGGGKGRGKSRKSSRKKRK